MESLVPTPDIFSYRIAECNSEGILAYSSWRNIVLVNVRDLPPVFQDFLEHHARLSALSFSKGRNPSLLVSGCDDGSVHVWDIRHSGRSISSFDNASKVLAVEWKYNSDNIVFSSDERAFVVEWNISTRSNRSLKTRSKNSIVVLSSCPHDPDLLAAGHRSGDVSILDLSTASVKYQLRSHTDNIVHVAWSPHSGDELLSTSKDNSIRIWSLEKEATLHVFSSVSPTKAGFNLLLAAMWHPEDPDVIICSSQHFVGTWNLKSNGKPTLQAYNPKSGMRHARPVAFIAVLNNQSRNIIFSVSVDRLIIFWDIKEKNPIYQLNTLGGSVYDLAFSTVAVGRLGVAVGDSNVRVWNVASSTTCPTQSFYVGTRSKVCTIAWHPEKENIIAFGTDDGRVGLIDTNLKKTSNISGSLHKTKVYKLSWGPCHLKNAEKDSKKILYLYSCGDGPIFIHAFGKDEVQDTVDFDELRSSPSLKEEGAESHHHTEISWKPDFSCLAVGNNDGSIEIYHGSTFAVMAQLKAQKKLIQGLQWHPTFTSLSSSPSTMSCWLACASFETTIHVYDLTNVLTKSESDGVVEITNATRELVGHSGRVSALVWSPHLEGRLASASYDCTAQVWDVISGETLANFRGHKARIFAIAWNVLDPDIVFTGGDDILVLQWRISEQTHSQPPSKGRNRKQKKKKADSPECLKAVEPHEENGLVNDGEFQENGECALEVNGKVAEVAIADKPVPANEEGEDEFQESSEQQLNDGEKSSNKETTDAASRQRTGGHATKVKKKAKNMMPVYGAMSKICKSNELLDCMKLTEIFSNPDIKNEVIPDILSEGSDTAAHLTFYGNQEMVLQWLNVEGTHHRDTGHFHTACELEMWKGNLGAALREAAERGDLNALLVSLAPSVSHSLWLEMCECFAKQLVQDKSYQQAALYLLACGKIYEAIDVLKSKNCFRDALALAKARLPSSDPVIKDIISAWCKKLELEGNCIVAAQWYIALNQPLKSASLLSGGEADNIKVAAFICSKFGYLREAKEYSLLCLKKSMLVRKWDVARQMIDEQQPTMNVYRILVAVHESMMIHIDILQNETEQFGLTEKVFYNCFKESCPIIWKSYLVREQNFLIHVFHALISQGLLPTQQENLLEEIEAISVLKENPGESHLAPNQAMMYVSVELVLFYLTLLTEKEEKFEVAAKHLNSVFKNCVASNYHALLKNLCLLSLPFDVAFNSEDLMLNFHTVGMDGAEILNQFFVWLKLRIMDQKLLFPVVFSGESDLGSPETLLSANVIQETKKKVCSLTPAESIVAYFFLDLLHELEVLICDRNFHAKCYYKIKLESDVVDINSIPQKLLPENVVEELVQDCPSVNEETTADADDPIEELLREAEKKIEFLKKQGKSEKVESHVIMSGDKTLPGERCEFGAETNQDLVSQTSKTESSVDLTAEVSDDEQHLELSERDCYLKSHSVIQNGNLHSDSVTLHEKEQSLHFSEDTKNETFAFRKIVESPSSHSRCLQSLKFYFYFINRMASNLCNDHYALLIYLRKKLKEIQNVLASRAAGHYFSNSPTLTDPQHVLEKENPSQLPDQVQIASETSDAASHSLECDSSSQPNGHKISDGAINSSEKGDVEKLQKCVSEDEKTELIFMQKTCQEITEFLDSVAEKNLFPDAIHASSLMLTLCNLVKERNVCMCIDEKLTAFIEQVTSWAGKFDVKKLFVPVSHGHPHVNETGDH